MKHRPLLYAALLIAGAGGWYAFRPERLVIDQKVNESLAVAPQTPMGPATLATGAFHGNAHPTTGTATILDVGDGRRVLRLTNFMTSNGPDVRVYLVAANDVNDDDTVKSAGFIELGLLKGNIGDQNYDVPASVDLARYRAVTIWCKRFSVNFGTAPLAGA